MFYEYEKIDMEFNMLNASTPSMVKFNGNEFRKVIELMKDDFNQFIGLLQVDGIPLTEIEDVLIYDASFNDNYTGITERNQALIFASFVFRALRLMKTDWASNSPHDSSGLLFKRMFEDANIMNNNGRLLRVNQELGFHNQDRAKYLTENAAVFKETFEDRILTVKYTNYAGVTSVRNIIPDTVKFMSSKYHNAGKRDWILIALDVDKMQGREFRLADLEGVTNAM